MPFEKQITEEQLEEIYKLRDVDKLSLRQIEAEVGFSKDTINYYLKKREKAVNGEELLETAKKAKLQINSNSVFDIVDGLENCFKQIKTLLDYDETKAPLRDKIAVRTEMRQLIREARETLESIYNIRVLNEFITKVTTILEEQSPGSRERIFARLEQVSMESGIKGI